MALQQLMLKQEKSVFFHRLQVQVRHLQAKKSAPLTFTTSVVVCQARLDRRRHFVLLICDWNCATGKHHLSLNRQLHTFWCPPAAIPAPVCAPAPYPALPQCTLLLLQCMSSCCAIAHTGLLFDFTPALR